MRSADTAANESGSFKAPTHRLVSASSVLVTMARAPCPGAGSQDVRSSHSFARPASPRRVSPAAAKMMASNCPWSSLRSLVSTLPRMVRGVTSRRKACSKAIPSKRTGAHHSVLLERSQGGRATLRAHENVAGIDPSRCGGNAQTLTQRSGKVLQRVDGQLDPVAEKRFVELPSKDTLAADLVKGLVEAFVTFGPDDLDLGLGPAIRLERGRDPFTLGPGEERAPCSQPQNGACQPG